MGGGDSGSTELGGQRLPKDDLRLEALGQLDELQALLALAALQPGCTRHAPGLRDAVEELARAMEALGGHAGARPFPPGALERLEAACRKLRAIHPPSGFVLPGADSASASLNLCRTVARRAERALCASDRLSPVPPVLMAWINRLSEWLFLAGLSLES